MVASIDFKDLVVLVTGAGSGIGKVYAHFYASRGAKVVVNDVSPQAAQVVVDEIKKAGGQAVAAAGSVAEGQGIVDQAVKAFGTIHVLINNAGILRDKSFKNMTDQDWDLVVLVHLKGAYSCTKACWNIFKQQKFGRIINTASAAGLYGNVGQSNYSSAKMGLVAFTKTLAREGAKYNIKANVIVPMAKSAMTETILPPEMLAGLRPELIAPLVGVLTAKNGPDVTGRIFELGAGFYSEVRWERAKGAIWKTGDATFTTSAVAEKWAEVQNFDKPDHPSSGTDTDTLGILTASRKLPPNKQVSPPILFTGKTVIITGAGAGLGRSYALMFGKLGANVVVNDVSKDAAERVVDEVKNVGSRAVAAVCSAEDGETIVKTAVETFGTVHILIANAGILRDKSFGNMDEKMWDQVIAVHLRGTYKCVKACWPVFQKQKYGRIITTTSPNGLYGAIGQANYSTAKAALIGLARTLAIEGARSNILVNCIAPQAGTAMTATVWPKEALEAISPDFVAPVVGYLVSDQCQDTGTLYETFGGFAAQVRWQRTYGVCFPNDKDLAPETIMTKWKEITTFDDRATNPSSAQEALQQIMENFSNVAGGSSGSGGDASLDPEDTDAIKEAKRNPPQPEEFSYTERDVLLYNLGVGARADELEWTFENSDDFAALPTFGVIPQFGSSSSMPMDFVPNFDPTKLLHGEQYLKILGPIPTSGTVVNHVQLVEVLDKGKAASVTVKVDTVDKGSGEKVFENQSTVFLRGCGGFGGKKTGSDRGAATAVNTPPKRQPDAIVEEKTTLEQAAVYRLSGDYNPLHIDPSFAKMGGFPKPILHGLCFMGIAGKHVLKTFGPYSDIKVRFAGTVVPGETLVTEMWKEGDKVIFVSKVKERNSMALSNAAVTLVKSDVVKAKL